MDETPPPPDACQLERLAAFLRLIPENGPLDRLLKGAALLETPPTTPGELASDMLYGASQIAHFLYGDAKLCRKVYRIIGAGKLPHFRLGANICSRKSILLKWITSQESKAARSSSGEAKHAAHPVVKDCEHGNAGRVSRGDRQHQNNLPHER